MVPVILNDIGRWLDRFEDALGRWEKLLTELRACYLRGEHARIEYLCERGEEVQAEIAEHKRERQQILLRAQAVGHVANSFRDLSRCLDDQWPALWTHRMTSMELQLNRIQQLSMSLWVTAFQSRTFVADLLKVLATGRPESATYAPNEMSAHEGGYLINEAA